MAALEGDAPHASSTGWLGRAWTIRMTPLGGLALAATLAALMLAGTRVLMRDRLPEPAVINVVAAEPADPARPEVTQFVLVAPDAKTVALVGDFNDWNLSATQLVRQAGDGVWWVTVTLPPGRYRYAFVVDGTSWRSDPNAPASEDEFGRPNSVVTVGGI